MTVTTDKVVDASALAAIMFEEPERDAMIGALDSSKIHAPSLLEYEIASVCLKKIRRDPNNSSKYLHAASMLPRFDLMFHPIEVRATTELAIQHNLSAYDASYLWLARALGADLVTLDAKLLKAAAAL